MKDDDYPAVDIDEDTPQAPAPHRPEFGQKKPSKGRRWLLIGGIALAVLALGGGGAYWFFLRDSEPAAPAETAANESTEEAVVGSDPDVNATLQTYKSDKLKLEFVYRTDWTLKETADKEEIMLTSPRTTYATKDGESKQGVFTVKLRNGVIPDAQQAAVHSLIAVKDSEVIGYDAPTEMQRHFTNLSYGGPDATNFSLLIVSGLVAYKAGMPFGSQIDLLGSTYLFVGGYGTDPEDTLAFEPVPAASSDTEAYQQGIAIIKSLKIF